MNDKERNEKINEFVNLSMEERWNLGAKKLQETADELEVVLDLTEAEEKFLNVRTREDLLALSTEDKADLAGERIGFLVNSLNYAQLHESYTVHRRPLFVKSIPMKYPNGILVRDEHGDPMNASVICPSTDEGAKAMLDDEGNQRYIRCSKDDPESEVVMTTIKKPVGGTFFKPEFEEIEVPLQAWRAV